MKRAWLALAGVFACVEPPRQALVVLQFDPALGQTLARITVTALTPDGSNYGRTEEFTLPNTALQRAPSFGAVPWSDGVVRLRLRGRDDSGALRLEQYVVARTRASGITSIEVPLDVSCLDEFPCRTGCDTADARELPACSRFLCELGTVDDCGACGDRCDTANASARSCVDGLCEPSCYEGYADCNSDETNDGCETRLASDAENCGRCGRICAYDRCVDGVCAVDCLQVIAPPAPNTARLETIPPNRVVGQLLYVPEGGVLAGLGVYVGGRPAGSPDVRLRLALYTSLDGSSEVLPDVLIDQTTDLHLSDMNDDSAPRLDGCGLGALEGHATRRQRVTPGWYWGVLVADGETAVWSMPGTVTGRLGSWPGANMLYSNSAPFQASLFINDQVSLRREAGPDLAIFPIFTAPLDQE